jgi:hypothetical protein
MKDKELEQQICNMLDGQVDEPDELTRAALRAARYRALDHMPQHRRPLWRSWWQSGLAFAGVLLGLTVAWEMNTVPVELDVALSQAEDAALIADLDLVLWLEESDV